MKEIKPDSVDIASEDEYGMSIFLAGTIDMGNSKDWQHEVVEHYKGISPLTFYNPRRDFVEGGFITDPDDFKYQVNWELYHQEKCSAIIMFIAGTSKSPITLMELGLFANSGRLYVICEPEFYRYGNVEVTCKRYRVPLYNKLEDIYDKIFPEHILPFLDVRYAH